MMTLQNLGVISTVRGYSWAGSEVLWHASAMKALERGKNVTAFLHSELASASQVAQFRTVGGEVRTWKAFPVARLQSLKDRIKPSFPPGQLNRFDAILVSLGSFPSMCYAPGLTASLLEISSPVVLLCQFNADHLAISPYERRVIREIIKKSAACVFVSLRNLHEARRQFAIEPPNASVVLNPIREIRNQSLPWPAGNAEIRFACVARFETNWKGQDLLLEILSSPQWKARNWSLRFYGGGPDLEHARSLSRFFGLEQRVSYEGFVSDLSAIWATNHILVLPSYGEGTPLAALEAMMFGRPVITTDVGGNREIIQDGVTGFISEGANARSFSAVLERAWDQRSLWPCMGEAAHRRARQIAESDPADALLRVWSQNDRSA